MGLKKGKGKSSPVNRLRIRGISTENTDDHWAFLEEIEAPMWVDLALEGQLMDQDIDDGWFRTSHPIHQTSSRHLKSSFSCHVHKKEDSPKLLGHSPKLPDSVSRSRGKHYKSRNWEGNKNGFLVDKEHPVRKLGAKGLGSVTTKSTSGSSSRSTLTTNTSLRKPLSSIKDMNRNYSLKSNSRPEASSSSSATSNYKILKPKTSSGDPNFIVDAEPAASEVCCRTSDRASTSKLRGSSNTRLSVERETKVVRVLQTCKSSSSKSSVGSSSSLRCKVGDISFTAVGKEQKLSERKNTTRSISILRMSRRQHPNRNSTSNNQGRSNCIKLVCQESKEFSLTATTKPLPAIDKSKRVKTGVVAKQRMVSTAGKFNSVDASDRENTKEGKIQNLKDVKQRKHAMNSNGLLNHKGKTNAARQERNLAGAAPKTYFR